MADGMISSTLGALSAPKGVILSGIAGLAVVSLLALGPSDGRREAVGLVTTAAVAQTAAPAPAPPMLADKSGTFSPAQVKALGELIKDYLMAHPEVLADVSKELERKQAAEQAAKAEKYLADNKARVFASGTDFILGNPKGDVTVVEFFDYNCGWCKRAVSDLITLTKSDPKVRVVLKEYPIFGGPPSVAAAKAAMASIKQNKYWEYHAALMREKQVTEANIFTIAEKVGLNVARLKADMADAKIEQTIEQNIQLGQGLGVEGTPGFIIDSRVNVGYVPADGIKQMLVEIRKTGCKMCSGG